MPEPESNADGFVVDPDAPDADETRPDQEPVPAEADASADPALPQTTEDDLPDPANPDHSPTDPNASLAGDPDEVAERTEEAVEAVGGDDRPRLETDDSAPPGSPLDEQEPNQTPETFDAEQDAAPDQTPPEPDPPAEAPVDKSQPEPETEHARQAREVDEIAARTGQDSSLQDKEQRDSATRGSSASGSYA